MTGARVWDQPFGVVCRQYGWTAGVGVVLALIAYAALAPFGYEPIAWSDAVARFRALRLINPSGAQGGGGNEAAFFLLYAALGLVVTRALRGGSAAPAWRRMAAAPGALVAGLILSVGLELAKTAFPPRVPSLVYVMVEWVGLVTGIVGWLVVEALATGRPWRRAAWRPLASVAGVVFLVGLVVVLAAQLWPFDFAPGRGVVLAKYREGRLRFLPFADMRREVGWVTSWNHWGEQRPPLVVPEPPASARTGAHGIPELPADEALPPGGGL